MLLAMPALPGGCGKKKPPPAPASVASVAAAVSAAPPPALRFSPDKTLRAGVPRGCTLLEPPQSAGVGPPAPLFFAPDEPRGELLLALPGEAPKIGVVPLDGGAPRPLALFDPERPPALAAAGRGWLQYRGAPEGNQTQLLREGGQPEVALEGEGLEAVDLRCRGDHCAALSTRAMRVAAAGATILVGRGGEPVQRWQRSDVGAEGASPERPFVVAAVGEGKATGTTISTEGVRFFETQGPETRPAGFVAAPFGALDAIVLKKPVVIAHGARLSGDCAVPRPLLWLAREGLPPQEIQVDAPPLSLFARPLTRGAFVAWLVPTHCGDRLRRIAYVALLDDEGALRSGPMAVTEATGLALATRGDQAELWLRRENRVAWLKLRCE